MLLRVRNDLVEAFPGQLESTVAHVHDTAVELANDPSSEFLDLFLLALFVFLMTRHTELTEAVLHLFNQWRLAIWIVLDEDALGFLELFEGLREPAEHAVSFSQVRMHVVKRAFVQRLLTVLAGGLMFFK